jgi:hypothetical protein
LAGTPAEPPTRVPRKASPFAARLWAQSVGERIELLINPNPETAGTFIRAGIESFDAQDLALYVETEEDVIPLLVEWMQLNNGMVKPLAQMAIRVWWTSIFDAAMDPVGMLADIRTNDPQKGAILDTPKGRAWFNVTVYNLLVFFRAYGGIQGDGRIEPPPNVPDRLKRRALTGAARLIDKVRGDKK